MSKNHVIGRLDCVIDGYEVREGENYVISRGLYETLKEAVRYLKESDRPTGKWLAIDGAWECALCGCREGDDSAYCPDCGADMRGNTDE